ncbi:MAG: ABC transporter permease subunit [Marinobacter sp.]|nr:ABC transporter permease subunit [Marinobacter sp.]
MESQFQFDWQAAIDSIPFLAKGIPYTLMISFGGLVIGFLLGILFGLLSINKHWYLRWPATAYIEIFRGTPILVQVLFIFYGLPDLVGGPIDPACRRYCGHRPEFGCLYFRSGSWWRAVY